MTLQFDPLTFSTPGCERCVMQQQLTYYEIVLSLVIFHKVYCYALFAFLLCSFYSLSGNTPCKLSFLYTSYIRYGVRAALKFGKHASLFSYHKDKKIRIDHHMKRNSILF